MPTDRLPIRLVLFLSRATPLSRWDQLGIFSREVALYKRLRPYIDSLHIVSSGGPEELKYQAQLGDIGILYNRWRLPANTYSLMAPFLHRKALQQSTVYKTNQLDGAWTAIMAARLYHKPVIVRAGYPWAQFYKRTENRGLKMLVIHGLQAFSFRLATHIVLTTEDMCMEMLQRYHLPPDRVQCISNYVDTHSFCPKGDLEPVVGRICYIGRLEYSQKNLKVLVQAVAQLPKGSLFMIGKGAKRQELEIRAQRAGADVVFAGVLPHQELPVALARSEIFVLPSLFEGHPKALIEAMACGKAVVGTDVPGIRNVIRHNKTGLLCPPSVEGLRTALSRLLVDRPLRERLGKAARQFVVEKYSLDRIVQMERNIFQHVQTKFSLE